MERLLDKVGWSALDTGTRPVEEVGWCCRHVGRAMAVTVAVVAVAVKTPGLVVVVVLRCSVAVV